MKYLIVLAIFSFVLFLLYWRLRPYIHAARRALNVVRQMQAGAATDVSGAGRRAGAERKITGGQLVKCAHCDTWVPEARALKSTRDVYCSTACAESGPAKTLSRAAR